MKFNSKEKIEEQGFLDYKIIKNKWDEHTSKKETGNIGYGMF